jgi:hypothetical protein
MWTLGRDREKEHARKFLGPSKDASLLEGVIDAVHDLIDGNEDPATVRAAFRSAFIDGAGGTWESAGSWLLKAGHEHAAYLDLWNEFSTNASATTRFRVAAFVSDLPEDAARKLLTAFLSDPRAKVRRKAAGDQHDPRWEWVPPLLAECRAIETDAKVIESLDFAIESIRGRQP